MNDNNSLLPIVMSSSEEKPNAPNGEKVLNPYRVDFPERGVAPQYDHGAFLEGKQAAQQERIFASTNESVDIDPREQMETLWDEIEGMQSHGLALGDPLVMRAFGKLRFWYEELL